MKHISLSPFADRGRSVLRIAVLVPTTIAVVGVVGPTPAASAPVSADGIAALRSTRTTVTCNQETLTPGASALCTAKVADTGSGKKAVPAGTVGFASTGPGSFDPASCILAASAAAAATCSMAYQPEAIGNGTHTITASYSGSETHAAGTGRTEVYVTPTNDARRNATMLRTPPSSIDGATIGATSDYSDPDLGCGASGSTVWYSLTTRMSGRIAVRIRARGRLDAVVAVFRRVRSQYKPLGCVPTDENGIGGVAFQAERGRQHLIVVGERSNSASSTFRLELFAPPLAKAPGARLPTGGARSSVDPLSRPEAAWSIALTAGRTYRLNLAPDRGRCLPLSLFRPGTSSFDDRRVVDRRPCGGYLVFTPGPDEGGRYSLLVRSEGHRGGAQRYRLQVARAGRDDLAPGLLIRNGQTRRGSLSARSIDVLDLYRFDVTHRTEVTARLRTPRKATFDLLLLSSEGNHVKCVCGAARRPELRAKLEEGQYFVAIRARGQNAGEYRVSLLIREITTTIALVEGVPTATGEHGRDVQLSAGVTPDAAVGGHVRFRIDHFDPIEGWQFSRILVARVGSGGLATVSWSPPTVGRWRVRAFFVGTRAASPSASAHALLLVRG